MFQRLGYRLADLGCGSNVLDDVRHVLVIRRLEHASRLGAQRKPKSLRRNHEPRGHGQARLRQAIQRAGFSAQP